MRTLIFAAACAALSLPVLSAPAAADPPSWAPAHGKRAKDRAQRWDPVDHYRKGDNYRARRLSADDRVYRGRDGRYYCERDDGTAGLIIGGLTGGTLGNVVAPDGSKLLGSIIGGAVGAYVGKSADDDGVTCR
ncbi:glycine zipper 2TM domain-containing protein [Pacificimonas sp. ICDLI1SI03]|jgi:hypothetical protein|tara:strand:- start:49137 stop:49535 length:399 start_codon:yes stop_codon:yes gene_type:complete